MGKHLIGEFEHIVLLTVLRLGEDAYGFSITNDLSARMGREVSQAATYLTLRRLEEKGWIRGREGRGTSKRGGRVKRYYRVTAAGLVRLKESRETLESMWAELREQLT